MQQHRSRQEYPLPFWLHACLDGFDISVFRDPEEGELRQDVMEIRAGFWVAYIAVFLLLMFTLPNWIFHYAQWPLFVGLAFVTFRVCFAWLIIHALGALAAGSVILMVVAAPIAVLSYLGERLYYDLSLAALLPLVVERDLGIIAFLSIPISILSIIIACWCVVYAQPYIGWSVAGFAHAIMAPLIAFKLLPVLFALGLWVFAPLIGQYVPDGSFWARAIGVGAVVVTMPSILWRFFESALFGLDGMSKLKQTREQSIYGENGFADPHAAHLAMKNAGYE